MSDARAINAMNETTRFGHFWLTHWCQAIKKDNPQPWPSITLLGRIIEQGGHHGSITGTRPATDLSDEDAAVDALVAHMRGDLRIAVLAYYGKWDTLDTVARALRWSPEKLSLQLRIAREVVAVAMSSKGYKINLIKQSNTGTLARACN